MDLSCGECNVISLYVLCFSVNGSVVVCLFKQFAICLGVVVILLFNVMELEVLCWMVFQTVYCACDPSVHLLVPSICFVCVYVCRKLSPHLRV